MTLGTGYKLKRAEGGTQAHKPTGHFFHKRTLHEIGSACFMYTYRSVPSPHTLSWLDKFLYFMALLKLFRIVDVCSLPQPLLNHTSIMAQRE